MWPIFAGVINVYISKPTLVQGTKDSPTIVHAMDNYRMVGCVCSEEDTNIKWTWLCEVRGNVPNYFSILLQIFFVAGRAQEVRVRLLDGAQDSPRPREVSPALVICLERILDHLCFILIIIVNKM